MDFTVARTEKYYFCGVTNEAEEVAAANYPGIRMFTGDWARSYEPRSNIPSCSWKVCTPETVREFSAIGYFFARDLQKELNVPIGILTLTYGASTAQAWIRREALAASPRLAPMLAQFDADVKAAETQTNRVARQAALAKWESAVAKAKVAGKKAPRRPRVLDPVQDQHSPTVMFNGVIAPVIPFAIRGVLWYQGESITTGGVELYPLLQSTLIQDWRRLWAQGDFPFYICQLAAYKSSVTDPNAPGSIPATREAQATVLGLTNTGMAVTIDIGDAGNVHPKNKQDVGNRLMLIALAKVYGRSMEYSGPMYESMKVEGGAIRVKFSHADGGLVAKGGPLKQLAIAALTESTSGPKQTSSAKTKSSFPIHRFRSPWPCATPGRTIPRAATSTMRKTCPPCRSARMPGDAAEIAPLPRSRACARSSDYGRIQLQRFTLPSPK
jgi:sialate O-acetylesterase